MMKKLTIIVALLISFNLLIAQGEGGAENESPPETALPPGYHKPEKLQESKAILDTEAGLNKQIKELNQRLQRHSKLFRMKVEIMPGKTVLKKGKNENGICITQIPDSKNPNLLVDRPQEDPGNDCLRLEVFDFLGAEEGLSEKNIGSRSKYIELFFASPAANEDPEHQEKIQVSKIRTRILVDHYKELDNKLSVIVVDGIGPEGEHKDEQSTVFYSHDGIPPLPPTSPDGGVEEQKKLKAFGKYKLSVVENTKTNPTRNIFKQTFYIKNLTQFDNLFKWIYDANERNYNKRYAETNKVMKNSLKY
ncbi:MAG: hypothetical protein H7A23_21600 [Leptospiraceae bacterium]|nr:hypothetical protein [Leptospiraceae bacterium]MCP5497159.1 hypothetical protein [Leptospiraceae bacterium]